LGLTKKSAGMENYTVICNCNEIYRSAIVKAIRELGLKTVEEA
jgi:NAD(P)H-nitrite reductase large subunit